MWKIFVGFIAFALIALFVIMKGGDKVDMQGEAGHGLPAASEHGSAPAASTPAASTPAAPAAAPAASESASAAPAAPAAAPAESSAPAASAPAASK
ncbi:MAG TPA: hypothetical protein VEC35_02400 [Noviherbaspirillum sp.]|nr:hypothetical protein [Noviherbaspirillum sp.]